MFNIIVVTITHFICDNHLIISCHYNSSQAEFYFCHLTFVLLDDLMRLYGVLKVFIPKYVHLFNIKCHIMERVIT
jgi:hypothetical protein